MEFVKKSQAKKLQNTPVCLVWEYDIKDRQIDGAVAEIKGRYPDKDRVVNENSKELVFILEGRGRVVVEGRQIKLSKGDLVLISPKERYYFQGDLKLFLVNTPKWTPQQHKLVK
jgi:mannose-6-phosphate isomerase-like protein (cupin superfamily)